MQFRTQGLSLGSRRQQSWPRRAHAPCGQGRATYQRRDGAEDRAVNSPPRLSPRRGYGNTGPVTFLFRVRTQCVYCFGSFETLDLRRCWRRVRGRLSRCGVRAVAKYHRRGACEQEKFSSRALDAEASESRLPAQLRPRESRSGLQTATSSW